MESRVRAAKAFAIGIVGDENVAMEILQEAFNTIESGAFTDEETFERHVFAQVKELAMARCRLRPDTR